MTKDKSNKIDKKWKSYFTGIITSNFMTLNKIDKYFRYSISESTSKAIHENWRRILGIDYEIISMNLCKENKPLGIALEGVNELNRETQEVIQHHFLKIIMPNFCIGLTNKFKIKDELLEINGLKVLGLSTKEIIHTLKKLTNYFQIVVARSIHEKYEMGSDYGGSEDNINSPISFYDMDEDESSQHGTLRSIASNYSTTSRDFGSTVSVGGLIDGQYETVGEYLKNMSGWRGPVVIEFRKQKERFGLAVEEIKDPKSSSLIIVFKIIAPKMIAGKDGRLHAGDRLLQVNGKSVSGIQFKKVCQWIKSAPGGRLVLCICKPHFEQISYDYKTLPSDDNALHDLIKDEKLPKLSEETDGESVTIPPAPEYLESNLVLKRVDNKLGIFFDVVDGGQNGARIKRISPGVAKDDGTLHVGDFIRKINGICLSVDDRQKLDYCLKKVTEDTKDYNICFITAEDVNLYKRNYSKQPPIRNIYPSPTSEKLEEYPMNSTLSTSGSSKLAFEEFDVTIENDHQTRLGLVISPSLKEPTRFITIIEIHPNTLAAKCGLLKINDDILMINEVSLERVSAKEAGKIIQTMLKTGDLLNFRVRRLTNSDDESGNESTVDLALEKLMMLPDIYSCSIARIDVGSGFSLFDIDSQPGVIVEKIDSNGSAYKDHNFNTGDRFVMINKCNVINRRRSKVLQIIKNSSRSLELIMEMPKFLEFSVRITKDSNMSLGLNVGGGVDTKSPLPVIESLVPNRTSKFSEEICNGDLIIELDDKKMTDRSHSDVIQILRSTGPESTFKICRRLPFIKRDLLDHYEQLDFPTNYFQFNQYSVSISKPIDNIPTFGISFVDVVILDQRDNFKELGRYKAVKCVENNSLADKYAPQINTFDYLISIDGVPVDSSITCQDLKEIIDSGSRVYLVLSRDIPYKLNFNEKDHDSPILLNKDCLKKSPSERSSVENLVNNRCIEESTIEPIYSTPAIEVEDHLKSSDINELPISQSTNLSNSEDIVELKQEDCENSVDVDNDKSEIEIGDPDQLNIDNEQENLEEEITENSANDIDQQEKPKEAIDDSKDISENTEKSNEIVDVDKLDSNANKDESENPEKSNDIVNVDKLNLDKDEDESKPVKSEDEPENPEKSIDIVNVDKLNLDKDESDPVKSENNPENLDKSREIVDVDKLDLNEDNCEVKDSNIQPDNEVQSGPSTPSDFGINIDHITVPRLENVELGFHVYGGVDCGPNGESFPVFVVGVEKDTCNWPVDRDDPYLRNGQNLLELNGTVLSSLTISRIEHLIQETKSDLNFKVVTFK